MRIADKIKEYGFCGSIGKIPTFTYHAVIKYCNKFYFTWYKKLPIDECSIVLESEGDCCDNAYALFDYMKENGYVGKYRITWLVDHPENFKAEENVQYVQKQIWQFFSKETIKALRTCKWYIYDHCNVMSDYKKREKQLLIYLSHGWGYKAPKGSNINTDKSRFDIMTATGPLAAKGLSEYWNSPQSKVVVTGYPRLDYLFRNNSSVDAIVQSKWKFHKFDKVIFWMPTFRQSWSKYISENYIKNETGLPVFNDIDSLRKFDVFLNSINSLLVFKLHHLQADLPVFKLAFNNIIVIRDEELQKMGIQLYQLINYADAMISDYSSISIDFMIVDKPIIYTLDDYEEYSKSRGLFPENAIDYMPGYHVYNAQELEKDISEIVRGIDRHVEDRRNVVDQYHTFRDGNSSKRILEQLRI